MKKYIIYRETFEANNTLIKNPMEYDETYDCDPKIEQEFYNEKQAREYFDKTSFEVEKRQGNIGKFYMVEHYTLEMQEIDEDGEVVEIEIIQSNKPTWEEFKSELY